MHGNVPSGFPHSLNLGVVRFFAWTRRNSPDVCQHILRFLNVLYLITVLYYNSSYMLFITLEGSLVRDPHPNSPSGTNLWRLNIVLESLQTFQNELSVSVPLWENCTSLLASGISWRSSLVDHTQ